MARYETQYIVKREFQYTNDKTFKPGDEFIPAGYPNDEMILRAPNLITPVTVKVEDKPKPKARRKGGK